MPASIRPLKTLARRSSNYKTKSPRRKRKTRYLMQGIMCFCKCLHCRRNTYWSNFVVPPTMPYSGAFRLLPRIFKTQEFFSDLTFPRWSSGTSKSGPNLVRISKQNRLTHRWLSEAVLAHIWASTWWCVTFKIDMASLWMDSRHPWCGALLALSGLNLESVVPLQTHGDKRIWRAGTDIIAQWMRVFSSLDFVMQIGRRSK